MALTDSSEITARGLIDVVRARVEAWRRGEHAVTQRMAGAAFIIRVASAGIMFASQILLARWMGSSEFGTYVYVSTWLLVLGDIVHLGIPLTAQRFVPRYTQAGSLDVLRGYLTGSRWLTFSLASVAAAIGALTIHLIAASLDNAVILPLYFGCAALPFYALTFMTDGLARAYDRIHLALLPPYIVRPLLIIGTIGILHVMGVKPDAAVAMGILAGAVWVTALIQMILLGHELKRAVPSGPKRFDVRHWLGTSLPIILVWGLYTLLISIDVLVLRQFRPAEDVAHYYAAAKTLALVSIIHFAVAAAAAHRFTAYHAADDHDGLAAFAAGTVRWVFWPSLALTLVMLALGRHVLTLFGPDFVDGYAVMAILAVGQFCRAAVGPAERLLNMLGQQRSCAIAYAAAVTVSIVGCFSLAPAYGGIGVAAAAAAAFAVESALLFAIARRRLGLHMFIWPANTRRQR